MINQLEQRIVPENTHISPTEGILSKTCLPSTLWKFQLIFHISVIFLVSQVPLTL